MQLEPWMFDIVILGIAAEGAAIWLILRKTPNRAWVSPSIWFLVSGALLMAAVRSVLAGVPHPVIGGILAISLVTHLACLRSAWSIVRRRA